MSRFLIIAAIFCARPAWATVTLDSTAAASSLYTNAPRTTQAGAISASIDSPAFSTGASVEFVVAIVQISQLPNLATVTVSQSSGTGTYSTAWTQVSATNCGPGFDWIGIYYAVTSSTLGSAVIHAALSAASLGGGAITIFPFSTSSTTLGVHTSGTCVAPSITLAGTTSGSVLLGGVNESAVGNSTFTPSANTTSLFYLQTSDTNDFEVLKLTSTSGGGSVTYGGTWSTSGNGAIAGLEILSSGGSPVVTHLRSLMGVGQ